MNRTQAVALGGAVLAVLVIEWIKRTDEAEQDPGLMSWLYMPSQELELMMSDDDTQAKRNEAAFLRMIRYAEGTAGANGYRTMFGGGLFSSFADHPRKAHQFTDGNGRKLWTSAAGAYQFMAVSPLPSGGQTKVNTWDRIKAKLGLKDFSPAAQDAAAIELIREAGALADVRAGRFDSAVGKVRGIWASMPGAGYAQPEKALSSLRGIYAQAGGVFA